MAGDHDRPVATGRRPADVPPVRRPHAVRGQACQGPPRQPMSLRFSPGGRNCIPRPPSPVHAGATSQPGRRRPGTGYTTFSPSMAVSLVQNETPPVSGPPTVTQRRAGAVANEAADGRCTAQRCARCSRQSEPPGDAQTGPSARRRSVGPHKMCTSRSTSRISRVPLRSEHRSLTKSHRNRMGSVRPACWYTSTPLSRWPTLGLNRQDTVRAEMPKESGSTPP